MSGQYRPNAGGGDALIAHRLTRLLRMTLLLHDGQLSRADLAARFGVSERRVTDDLRILRLAGVDVQRDRAGYWIDWLTTA